jgi:hypothetical protein
MDSLSSDLDQCDKNVSILRCLVEVVRSLENADASEYYRVSVKDDDDAFLINLRSMWLL